MKATQLKLNAEGLPKVIATVALTASILSTAARAQLPEHYLKRWGDPAVQMRIDEGIEKNRKADVELAIVDASGKPVPGAKVRIAQQKHEFLFGCNTFVLGQMEDKEQAYREAFLKLFNATTVPFYWKKLEPEQGQLRYEEGGEEIWRRPPPDRVVAFAKEHGLTMRGHPLLWLHRHHHPKWAPEDPEALKEVYRARFREIARRYAGDIPIWDVVNESLKIHGPFPLQSMTEKDYQPYVPWTFKEVAEVFGKDNRLAINDITWHNWPANEENRYYRQCAKLIAEGVRLEGIGFQFHCMSRNRLDGFLRTDQCDPSGLLATYEMFAGLGRPLEITEITLGSAGENGEAIQERVVRDLYRLWFSAPNMTGITWWNLGDGTALKGELGARGGLVDENMQPKPAYRALDQLINHDWKTKLETQADEGGRVDFRGFRGDYTVEVIANGKTKSFPLTVTGDGPVQATLTMP